MKLEYVGLHEGFKSSHWLSSNFPVAENKNIYHNYEILISFREYLNKEMTKLLKVNLSLYYCYHPTSIRILITP